jgi:hypothetical protein
MDGTSPSEELPQAISPALMPVASSNSGTGRSAVFKFVFIILP